jgi:transcriptional regulator with XRE-family HTH domain
MMTFGKELNKIRGEKGYSFQELADLVRPKVDRTYIAKMEQYNRIPSLSMILELQRVLEYKFKSPDVIKKYPAILDGRTIKIDSIDILLPNYKASVTKTVSTIALELHKTYHIPKKEAEIPVKRYFQSIKKLIKRRRGINIPQTKKIAAK